MPKLYCRERNNFFLFLMDSNAGKDAESSTGEAAKKNVSASAFNGVVITGIDKVFGYMDQGLNDVGWGCVYRNVQTLRRFHKSPHKSVWSMVKTVHPSFATRTKGTGKDQELGIAVPSQYTQLWIEPTDVKKYKLMQNVVTALYCPAKKDISAFLRQSLKRSKITDFDHVFRCQETFWDFVQHGLEHRCPMLIDDKAYSYVLYGITKDAMIIADPHQTNRTKRKCLMPLYKLFSKPWMVVRRNTETTCT